MASAGQAQAHSSQPTHFSRPSGCRLSTCPPWQRGLVTFGSKGYSSVVTFLNICAKVSPKPCPGAGSTLRLGGLTSLPGRATSPPPRRTGVLSDIFVLPRSGGGRCAAAAGAHDAAVAPDGRADRLAAAQPWRGRDDEVHRRDGE